MSQINFKINDLSISRKIDRQPPRPLRARHRTPRFHGTRHTMTPHSNRGSASCRHVSALPAVHGSASPTFPPNRARPYCNRLPRALENRKASADGALGELLEQPSSSLFAQGVFRMPLPALPLPLQSPVSNKPTVYPVRVQPATRLFSFSPSLLFVCVCVREIERYVCPRIC